MDIVDQKYNNFKAFLKPHINDTAHQMALNAASLDIFLKSLAQYKDLEPSEITLKICTAFSVDVSQYSREDIEKFYRYLQYFIEIIKTTSV